ncbi:MAG: hypothetical protein ABEK50_15245 [bacterium]
MKISGETLDWLLKAGLWIGAEESFEDAFEALQRANAEIRSNEEDLLKSTSLQQSDIHRLLETVIWTSRAVKLEDLASNLVEIFTTLGSDDIELNGHSRHFNGSLFECDILPSKELTDFWNLRVKSAKSRGASSSLHSLFDYVLRMVEIGLHPLKPDPVSFIVGEFDEDRSVNDPGIEFIVEVFHRSARITVDSRQFISIHDKVIWVDDSSGRMGVVGGEPLPVLGQPEGDEAALRIENEGEEILQPFNSIQLIDEGDKTDE